MANDKLDAGIAGDGVKADAAVVDGADKVAATDKAAAVDTKAADAGKLADKGTIVSDGAVDDKGGGPASFPDDWRKLVAGDDDKAMKTLERLASPKALFDSYQSLRKQLDGKALVKPGADATPEEVAAWRKANDVPEKPEEYKIALRDKRVLGDNDKPVFDDFAKAAHEAGFNNAQLSKVADWYLDRMEHVASEEAAADDAFKADSMKALREEWQGPDFKRNVSAIQGLFNDAPEGLFERMFAGRTGDGKRIGDDPDFMRFFAKLALEINPAATLLPAGQTTDQVKSRLDEIADVRRTNPDKYWGDQAMQQEELRLIEANLAMQGRTRGSKAA